MDVFPTTMAVGVSNASQDPFMQLRRIRISTADKPEGDVPCESHLFVGDSCGRIHVWSIRGLRNLRTQPKRVNHGGPNDYQTLKIFEFTTSPEITELKFSTPEQELADQLAAKLDEPLPPLKPSISQRIFAIN
ncbi:hypothetical protein AAHC03_010048 [Spirometra sp. Aus1]